MEPSGGHRAARRSQRRRFGSVALLLSLAIVAGCTSDPGGVPLRVTEQDRHNRWVSDTADALNAYSRGYASAVHVLDERSGDAGELDRAEVERIVSMVRAGASDLAAGLRERPYPDGGPLPDGFSTDLIQLLIQLDGTAEDLLGCRSDCIPVFRTFLRVAEDVFWIDVALVAFERLSSPLASRRHRLSEGLVTATTLEGSWESSDIDVTTSADPCPLAVRSVATEPAATEVSRLQRSSPSSLAEHTLTRFSTPAHAAQYFNRLRIVAALCREGNADVTDPVEMWNPPNLPSGQGLPILAWRQQIGASGSVTVSTVAVLVSDTVSRVSVAAAASATADALAAALLERALAALQVEVPQS